MHNLVLKMFQNANHSFKIDIRTLFMVIESQHPKKLYLNTRIYVKFQYLETSSQAGIPSVATLPPRDVWHLAGVNVGVDACLTAGGHAAEHLDGVISHAQVWIDPVVT